MLITRDRIYCGQPVVFACDARCDKAWGINQRPSVQLSGDVDDIAFLADHEVGTAPENPGTYEGGQGKPWPWPPSEHNKWCVRECERSEIFGSGEPIVLEDFSRRRYNCPHLHENPQAAADAIPLSEARPRNQLFEIVCRREEEHDAD